MRTQTVPATGILAIADALDRIRTREPVAGLEHLAVADSLGRFLAEQVVAPYPVPAHDSSAMDGYAFRFADYAAQTRMIVQGRVAAGHPLGAELRPGQAVRIFTGGAMPTGADTVAVQEDCVVAGSSVDLPPGLAPRANRRAAGEDMAAGTTVLAAGTRIGPQHIGVATAVGRTSLTVRRRIRVAVLATGDELRPPGQELPVGCVHDTNRHAVGAALRALGAEVDDVGVVPDRPDLIRAAISAAAPRNDLVVSTGGVSTGEEDHVRAVVESLGGLDFWRLPVKPGKSIAVGEVCGTPFVGLPGNPVAAMVAFWLIGRPLALRLMGAAEIDFPRFPVVSDFKHRRKPGRREFLRARLHTEPDGSVRAQIHPSDGSGIMRSLAWAEGLIEILEEDGDVDVGDIVRYVPYQVLDH